MTSIFRRSVFSTDVARIPCRECRKYKGHETWCVSAGSVCQLCTKPNKVTMQGKRRAAVKPWDTPTNTSKNTLRLDVFMRILISVNKAASHSKIQNNNKELTIRRCLVTLNDSTLMLYKYICLEHTIPRRDATYGNRYVFKFKKSNHSVIFKHYIRHLRC